MRKIFVALFTLALAQVSFAQPNPDTLWTRTYGGNGVDKAYSVQQTTNGGYIVAGYTYSFGVGAPDMPNVYLVKTNPLGDTLWTRTYGGSHGDYAYFVQQTNDGGYIIAGETNSFGAGWSDFYVMKTDSLGDTLWTRTYAGRDFEKAQSIQQTSDGGYIVAGITDYNGVQNLDFYLVKTDSQGDTLWTRTYGGNREDMAYSVRQTTDGGYIVAGYTTSFGADCDFYLVKTNSQGDTLWTHTYGGQYLNQARCVQQTPDDGFIVAGYANNIGNYDFYLVKTNSQGDTLWTRTYGGIHDDYGQFVQLTTDGGYIMAGYTISSGAGGLDIYLIKVDSLGNPIWTRTYAGYGDDYAFSVEQTTDGGYIMAGYTDPFGANTPDLYLVKTGPDISAAEPFSVTLPASYALSPSWPNPFNPTTMIRYDVRKTGPISLIVFDLLGREVATLVQGTIPAGSHSIAWDAADLPSGIYFCRMEAAGFAQTRKMVLVK